MKGKLTEMEAERAEEAADSKKEMKELAVKLKS
jgi:hypothetical protein